MARLCVVGVSHQTAPLEVRERFRVADEAMATTLRLITAEVGLSEAMIVSTCNRVELYAGIDGGGSPDKLRHIMTEWRLLPSSLRTHLYCHEGEAAIRHLFRVSASLDSLVVGEPQILGQIKEAYARALAAGTIGTQLQRVLPRAFALAKRVRTETGIGRSAASIASVAVDLGLQIFGSLEGRSVLVIGAGEMGELAARHFRAAGIGNLCIVNRTAERAAELASALDGVAVPWSELHDTLVKVDIVLCSTGAPKPILCADEIRRVMRARRGRWLFFIDIAVPRDVDPDVGRIENVYLYDVDALGQMLASNRSERARAAEMAEALVEEELRRLATAERTNGAIPTIKSLRTYFHRIARQEAERAIGRLGHFTPRERALILQLGETIANKLLHPPTTALKRDATAEDFANLAQAVRQLFALESEQEVEIQDEEDSASQNIITFKVDGGREA
jgi:glutamyl-tRNA reductase